MSKPNLIVMVGDMGAGKSTAAEVLRDQYGYEIRTFAAILKDVVFRVFEPLGMERRHLWGSQEDKNEVIPGINNCGRKILQLVGTEGFRAAYPDVWAKFVLSTVDSPTVIDDGRFENEVSLVREAGGHVWKILRPDNPVTGNRNHASEGYWRTCEADKVVESKNIEGLRHIVRCRMREYEPIWYPTIDELPEEERKPFTEFMRGQTGPLNPDGTLGYYSHDYERWKARWLK
jgi:hypothetical protein